MPTKYLKCEVSLRRRGGVSRFAFGRRRQRQTVVYPYVVNAAMPQQPVASLCCTRRCARRKTDFLQTPASAGEISE